MVSRTSTVILGLEAKGEDEPSEHTCAEWKIPLPQADVRKAEEALLVIGCKRAQAGLHSMNRDALTHISINGTPIDVLGVWTPPPTGTDFWYAQDPSRIEIPEISELRVYAKVFAWSLDTKHLRIDASEQVISVDMDPDLNWDIDVVGLLARVSRRRVHRAVWVILMAAVSAVFGALARKLF